MATEMIRQTLAAARDHENTTPDVAWKTRYALDVMTLLGEKDFTYCAYCGARFPVDGDAEQVADHIRGCVQHPMYRLRYLANEVVRDWLRGDPDDAIRTLQRFLREES